MREDSWVEPLNAAFQRDILADVEAMKRELNYTPSVFLGMVSEHGAVDACRWLVAYPDGSDGFTKLWENGRLAMTVEALVLKPWYAELFGEDVRERARDRLERYGFDVDAFLDRAQRDSPAWWTAG